LGLELSYEADVVEKEDEKDKKFKVSLITTAISNTSHEN